MSYEFLEKVDAINIFSLSRQPVLSWSDLKFGYENRFIGWMDVVTFAKRQLSDDSDECFALSLIKKDKIHEVPILLDSLSEFYDEPRSKRVWLAISLQWVRERSDSISEPLPVILDLLAADFGYPEACNALVTHSTSVAPDFIAGLVKELDKVIINLIAEPKPPKK